MSEITIGVLAIQGGYDKHIAMLEGIGCHAVRVKRAAELGGCDGLVIPGGESTTMTLLMRKYDLYAAIKTFARDHAVMGTCAGAIMLSSSVDDHRVESLNLIDIEALRNSYGRQVESFITQIETPFTDDEFPLRSIFIRAPRLKPSSDKVTVLATYENEPVILQQGTCLVLSFHPELSDDPRIHRYFVETLVNR